MKKAYKIIGVFILLAICLSLFPMKADAALTLHWPVPGHFSLTQNYHSGHKAIDISDSTITGAKIVSVCDGTINKISTCTKNHPGSYDCSCSGGGTSVRIKGVDGRYYVYAHMKAGSTSGLKVGGTVKAGQTIGYVGNTGNSYGAHLHYAIVKDTSYTVGYNPEKETYINTGVAKPFSFAKLDSKMSVSNTNATIAVRLTKPLENRLIKYGAAVYNENGVKLAAVSEASSITSDTKTIDLYWDVTKSMGITLMPGTKYQFDFWANVSGVTLTSAKYSFTTTGTPTYTVNCYDNYSGKNYFVDSDFTNGLNTSRYASRNSSVYTLSVDTQQKHDPKYNSLKIVGASAGATSKDLQFVLTTSASGDHQYYVGDSTTMTMSFWGKSSVNGAKMYIRWGYQAADSAVAVTLSDTWQYYTVSMPRQTLYGNNLHPYFDKAGTFWLSELQMEDGTKATTFVPENGKKTDISATPGKTYSALPTPTRTGYVFKGWYTNATAGTPVKSTDAVKKGNLALYAHWEPSMSITKQPVSAAAYSGETAKTTVTATGDGLSYTWYYKDTTASSYKKSSITTKTYSAEMNSWRNGRKVYCVVTDKYGNSIKSNVVTLSVKNKATITKQPTNVVVPKGQQIKTSITATGDGLNYTWYYKNKGASSYLKSSITTNTYSLTMDANRNGRQVYCVVKDKYGNSVKSSVVTLTMGNPAKITKQPTSVTVASGATAKTTVTATGDGLSYTWYYKDTTASSYKKSSITTKTYSAEMNSWRSGRKVYCVIADKYGNTVKSNVVTLNKK